jgi:hypothetical protein
MLNDHKPYSYTSVISIQVLVRKVTAYLNFTIASQNKNNLGLQRRLDKTPFLGRNIKTNT